MKRLTVFIFPIIYLLSGQMIGAAAEKSNPNLIVDKSRIVVEEMMMDEQDDGVPEYYIKRCSGVAIFPGMFKAGFILGGSYGKGVVLRYKGGEWAGPAFYSIGAGSLGLQIGAQSIDLILVIFGNSAMDAFMRTKFKLGGDIAVAAGPVGAQATAATEILLRGGIYSYSRTKGVFAGLSLEGAGLATQRELNKAYYEITDNPNAILDGKLIPPQSGQDLIKVLNKLKQPSSEKKDEK